MIPELETTRLSLLDGLRQRDPESWSELIDLYGPLVYAWVQRANVPRDMAVDVVQDTMLAVSESINQFRYRGPSDQFRGWLYGITRRQVAQFWRRRERMVVACGGSTAAGRLANLAGDGGPSCQLPPDESEATSPGQRVALIRRAADLVRSKVSSENWAAFIRTAIDGQSATHVAQELGLTPAAVRQAKSRVAKRLREQLGEWD